MVERLGELAVDDARIRELVENLNQLPQEWDQRFSMEECEGCLDEAVSGGPCLGREVGAFKADQSGLLDQLDMLSESANRLSDGSESSHFSGPWRRLVMELSDHGSAEDRALWQGLESAEEGP